MSLGPLVLRRCDNELHSKNSLKERDSKRLERSKEEVREKERESKRLARSKEEVRDKEREKAAVAQYEIPMNIVFDWLAQEAGWPKKHFDSRLIDRTF